MWKNVSVILVPRGGPDYQAPPCPSPDPPAHTQRDAKPGAEATAVLGVPVDLTSVSAAQPGYSLEPAEVVAQPGSVIRSSSSRQSSSSTRPSSTTN